MIVGMYKTTVTPVDTGMCEVEHEVCDADFGYWNEAWGDPPVHVFPCGEPAEFRVQADGPFGGYDVILCAEHANEA